ncbi:MAG: hypothetical protein ACXABV_06000 [Candidatus Thorarchaeota archaeon]|jgi:hypothetical protein
MTRRQLLVLLILASTAFNVLFIIVAGTESQAESEWPFVDLGPAVIQDSYHNRAPVLESPFGMIGDVPGGYSPYSGNPLQNDVPEGLSDWIAGETPFSVEDMLIQIEYLLLAVLFAIIPLLVIIIAGRKSFGSAKTQ